jgi:hypothetical protein
MTNRGWLIFTTLGIVGLFGANLLLSYALDVYGILRDPHGRSLATSGLHIPTTDDRISKYLLNQRYVPSNFDGLLIGSSTTGNWNPDLISGYHIAKRRPGRSRIAEPCARSQYGPHRHWQVR